jgi:hypothetical protein
MPHLNDSQKRHLVTTFRHVDRLLAGAAKTLAATASPGPFQDVVPDATPAQAKVIEDSLARFREALVEALAVYGVRPPPPAAGAVWSARTALLSAEIALEDLTPRSMRAYGELPDAAAAPLERIAAELTSLVRRMARDLGAGLSRDRHDTPPARPAQPANGGAMSEKSQGCPFCRSRTSRR